MGATTWSKCRHVVLGAPMLNQWERDYERKERERERESEKRRETQRRDKEEERKRVIQREIERQQGRKTVSLFVGASIACFSRLTSDTARVVSDVMCFLLLCRWICFRPLAGQIGTIRSNDFWFGIDIEQISTHNEVLNWRFEIIKIWLGQFGPCGTWGFGT